MLPTTSGGATGVPPRFGSRDLSFRGSYTTLVPMDSDPPLEADRFPVTPELAGLRLDRALQRLLPHVSRTRMQEWVRDGGVLVDGTPAERSALLLEEGSVIELRDVPRSRERRGGPEKASLHVVYEDEHLAVIDKAAGLVTHPSSVVRGGTVSELAVALWGELPVAQGEDRPGIVHRLDADTSGLMVLARTEDAAADLLAQFRAREVKKTYLAIVHGEPRFDSDWIDAPIGRSPKHPDRMSVRPADDGLPAETFYETRHRQAGFGVVACFPKTGRTHQIRVHLSHIEHPLVGDSVYRGRRGLSLRIPPEAPSLSRHALHSCALAFRHPASGEEVRFTSSPPADMQKWLRWLGAPELEGPPATED